MWYLLNANGEIACTSSTECEGYTYTDEEIVPRYDEMKMVFKHETETPEYQKAKLAYESEAQVESLRFLRDKECYSIINRGQLWYDKLTEEQITELNSWYQEWLDVTETLKIPEKPTWLV